MEVAIFVFNAFAENTFVLYNDSGECLIVDPGCNDRNEEKALTDFIVSRNLTPTGLVNTHFHIDHVLGNQFVCQSYDLLPRFHQQGMYFHSIQDQIAKTYGIEYKGSPEPRDFLMDDEILTFGTTRLKVIHVPGHSRGSICLYHKESHSLIAGDVLFRESIGRTDLPGGDHDNLLKGIREKLFVLPSETKVYPGHGPSTTIGHEKNNNPFF